MAEKFYCAGPSCPGYSYKASDIGHPPACAVEPKLTTNDCLLAADALRESHPLLARKLRNEARTGRGYKQALLRVSGLVERRVIEEADHRESAKYAFVAAELDALYEWITDDVADADAEDA